MQTCVNWPQEANIFLLLVLITVSNYTVPWIVYLCINFDCINTDHECFFGGRSLHCHCSCKQNAVLLFSCHAHLFFIWIHVTEGDTLLCEMSKAQENFACCFMCVYNVVSHITWRTQAMEAEKNSWIKRFMISLFSRYYYGDQIKLHVAYMGNNRYAYGILGGGDLKECAWKLRCRCEVNIKLRGLSPRANYTDRAAAAGRRS